jgi:hypothetical protein
VRSSLVGVICILALLTPAEAQAPRSLSGFLQPVNVQNGFITGTVFREWPEVQQDRYVMGLLDGMFLAPLFGAPEPNMSRLRQCVVGMGDRQLSEMLRLHLAQHPEIWHQSAHGTMFAALAEKCR